MSFDELSSTPPPPSNSQEVESYFDTFSPVIESYLRKSPVDLCSEVNSLILFKISESCLFVIYQKTRVTELPYVTRSAYSSSPRA
jgi:hypothetical protein